MKQNEPLETSTTTHTDRLKQKKTGRKKYQGKPCKFGHNGTRYVANRVCVECLEMRREKRQSPVNDLVDFVVVVDGVKYGPVPITYKRAQYESNNS